MRRISSSQTEHHVSIVRGLLLQFALLHVLKHYTCDWDGCVDMCVMWMLLCRAVRLVMALSALGAGVPCSAGLTALDAFTRLEPLTTKMCEREVVVGLEERGGADAELGEWEPASSIAVSLEEVDFACSDGVSAFEKVRLLAVGAAEVMLKCGTCRASDAAKSVARYLDDDIGELAIQCGSYLVMQFPFQWLWATVTSELRFVCNKAWKPNSVQTDGLLTPTDSRWTFMPLVLSETKSRKTPHDDLLKLKHMARRACELVKLAFAVLHARGANPRELVITEYRLALLRQVGSALALYDAHWDEGCDMVIFSELANWNLLDKDSTLDAFRTMLSVAKVAADYWEKIKTATRGMDEEMKEIAARCATTTKP